MGQWMDDYTDTKDNELWPPHSKTAEPERFFPFEFEVWQGDEMVASASGPRDDAMREAMHYAAQYEQDGPVRVFEVTRTLVRHNVKVRGPEAVLSPEGPLE